MCLCRPGLGLQTPIFICRPTSVATWPTNTKGTMGRGRQSRQKVADRVRRERSYKRWEEEHGRPLEPENRFSPSSVFKFVGQSFSYGLTEGWAYAIQREASKAIAQQRLDARPLWKIAISERRIHAKAYDDRKKNDIRHRMRDRAELKTMVFEDMWGDRVSGVVLDEFTAFDHDIELGEID
jgi:hypothetical protein